MEAVNSATLNSRVRYPRGQVISIHKKIDIQVERESVPKRTPDETLLSPKEDTDEWVVSPK